MIGLAAVFRRELGGYFHTPTAYVFLAIYVFASGAFGFHIARFFDAQSADLAPFFVFQPWLMMIFLPAIAMRLWAEEMRSGALELLLTLPVPLWASVVGKFLAAWAVAGAGLALTWPLWITINALGDPDNGATFVAYVGAFLMAGGYVAIGTAASAMTANQVIAFVVGVFIAFLFTVAGLPIVVETVSGFLPASAVEAVAGLSPLERFDSARRGVIQARDLVYFLSLMAFWLGATWLLVAHRRGG